MKKDPYEMTMLFDFYGEVLTEKQREFFDLYYNEDLSLGEIAQNEGISRQGVRDVIVRAEGVMRKLEEKTGIVARFTKLQSALSTIEEAAVKIREINFSFSNNSDIERLASQIITETGSIKE